jgi:hypothetical protein
VCDVPARLRRVAAHGDEEARAQSDRRLAHVYRLRNDLDARRPDIDDVTRLLLQRCPDFLDDRPDETFHARPWFRTVWYSYYLDELIEQVLTYALLAHHDRHRVTHVAVYAARYQRLLRYPIQELANRLAGEPLDLTAAASDLVRLIRDRRRRRGAA